MNITGITRRIEISFWTFAVRLMEEPKKLRLLLLSLALLLSLSFGWLMFSTVQAVNANKEARQAEPAPVFIGSQPAVQTQWATSEPVTQRKLLVIVVNRLVDPDPQLVSVWLTTYVPVRTQTTWFSLYPASLSGGAEDDLEMVETFQLSAEGDPERAFFELIQSKELAWDNFILLDEFGLVELIDMTGGIDFGAGKVDGMRALAQIPHSSKEPRAALFAHAKLAESFCLNSEKLIQEMDVKDVIGRLASHMRTDLSEKSFVEEWRHLRTANSGLDCEFPTLPKSFSKALSLGG